ncbi:cytochrome c oxidase subunit 3 [Alicyclobacillus macrosporangiidus]|uniref:cytochrome c oxidase subunit 3 n=1 Tax=Alicyclobacillus macrosporangiidus TaxID=392015 RepID=UPI000AA710DA|nr:cytochrome c oxidase subunit 3 [Alicyclobacillus macrosporangiidus]
MAVRMEEVLTRRTGDPSSTDHPGNRLELSTEDGVTKIFGFWMFLVSDVLLFATLFATYVVIYTHTADGPSAAELFRHDVSGFLAETLALLTSSFTCGLATWEMHQGRAGRLKLWMIITLLLGLTFLGLEITEFHDFVSQGATMQTSAFLSGFYTLVGTHGAHVTLGILWMSLILYQLVRFGLNAVTARKFYIVGLYWHFLDIVWVLIFTVVYLTGVM